MTMAFSGLWFFLAATIFHISLGTPVTFGQTPLKDPKASSSFLRGKFLHITDLHPDPFYKTQSLTSEKYACHRGEGLAGPYGAEKSHCDSPFELISATFKWIKENVKDEIDFVIYTGDSARHENDELIPRTKDEILDSNRWIVSKLLEVFHKSEDPDEFVIPIVSTLGNNDVLPHNVMLAGPNNWLREYTDLWGGFIPEEQRNSFEKGGWYYIEVIPQKLVVLSLNTLYFFAHNNNIDGCDELSGPGYEHFEWLQVQLQDMRRRSMKAILVGHVPPARTKSKNLWKESCWQKYTLLLQRYRDVVTGGIYGHMNLDHFLLHDTEDINIMTPDMEYSSSVRSTIEEKLSIESARDYLEELRKKWATLPALEPVIQEFSGGKNKAYKDHANKKTGGPWGERYQVTFVSPSVVPNFQPSLRIFEYNISGLDLNSTWAGLRSRKTDNINWLDKDHLDGKTILENKVSTQKQQKSEALQHERPTTSGCLIPSSPTKGSPPGPAYSPQTLTLLGYTQYSANITFEKHKAIGKDGDIETNKLQPGRYLVKQFKNELHPESLNYQVEYATFTDPVYRLKDMTVRSYVKLARRIGQLKPSYDDRVCHPILCGENNRSEMMKNERKKHQRPQQRLCFKNRVWLEFVKRAFVGTLEQGKLKNFHSE